ncbi:ABC transporter ATP-binding protein [Marivibrio halodurans]|uniref:ABC transporter ATP-binding protein n=1 Tax=Marivibrio halodurans TaxID=2039722 RepID=A0A8J7V1L9_9PROT|nr:ABC transporter ATP-binding protein [Marivibrio halodurans]MBP5856241.1 ABC transporter ATP-binding protein [Marivibrio halodurans]
MNEAPSIPLLADAVHVDRGTRRVLSGVSVSAGRGEVLGLIGPNGAGKTTLLRALLGLQPLAAGRIAIAERALEHWPRAALGRQIAYLPQAGGEAWPVRVERFVTLGRLPHLEPWRGPSRRDREIVAEAMAATDVARFAHRPVTALSGGERTRVHLARTLAVGAPILLVDEPVTGLDPYHQLQVMEMLRDQARERDRTVVVVLHDLTLAHRFCDRLALLAHGRIAAHGPPGAVLRPDIIGDVYHVSLFQGADGAVTLPWTRITDDTRGETAA